MAEIWLWNSIATRKRSASDNFLENGLALLKSHLEKRGHRVKVIDWANLYFYRKLSPRLLLYLNRLLTIFLFRLEKKNKKGLIKLFFPCFFISQGILSFFQRLRMKHHLKKLARDVVKADLKIFGVKVWYGEAFTWSNFLIKHLKKLNPSILTIAGGYHATLYEEDFLRYSDFDLAVVGEGEKPLEEILTIVEQFKANWDKDRAYRLIVEKAKREEIKNLVYRDDGEIKITSRYTPNMAEKSFPSYGDFSKKVYIHVLVDSVGCPWGRCNFCVHPHFYPNFSPRMVKDIADEIELLLRKGVSLFRFAGSETPLAFGVKIAEEILSRDLKIKFSIGGRAIKGVGRKDIYEKVVDNYKKMIKAGLCAIFMGGEAGNDIINEKVMHKGITVEELILSAKAFQRARQDLSQDCYLSLALIYPAPLAEGVTLKQLFYDNLNLIREMKPDSVIITPAGPFKHTDWYRNREKYGFKFSQDVIEKAMEYEYVLYKPTELWPDLDVSLDNMNFKEMLKECQRLREEVEKMGIPTDLTDEYFLMMEGAGYKKKDMLKFKEETLIDLVSSDYYNIKRITLKVNQFSKKLADANLRI